jgi:AraC-like DNA-binding protein
MLDREDFETRIFSYYLPLQRVREFVDSNLSEPIPLRAAARAAGLEEKYFSAFFHRKTGVCFRDWLAGRRVERAITILKQRDDTITSVAASVGFQDLRTFERAFKRRTGVTPREFKRSVAPEILAPQVREEAHEEGGESAPSVADSGGEALLAPQVPGRAGDHLVQRLDDSLDRLHVLAPWFHGSPPESRSRYYRARA